MTLEHRLPQPTVPVESDPGESVRVGNASSEGPAAELRTATHRTAPRTVALLATVALVAGGAGGAIGAAAADADTPSAPAAASQAVRTSLDTGLVSDVAARVLPSVVSIDVRSSKG